MQNKLDGKTARHSGPLSLEPLEDRIAPAGNVDIVFANGDVTITGDQYDNDIVIDAAGLAAHELRISSGSDATTINGLAGPLVIPDVTGNVTIALHRGNDEVLIQDAAFAKNLSIAAGIGWNDVTVASTVTVAGNLAVDGKAGAQEIDIDAAVSGNVFIRHEGKGDTLVELGGSFGRNVKIDLAHDDDTLRFDGASIAGNVQVFAGKGVLDARFDSTSIGGNLKVQNGIGAAIFDADALTVGGKLQLILGKGNSSIDFDDSTVHGAFAVENGAGTDTFHAADSTFGTSVKMINARGASDVSFVDCNIGTDAVPGSLKSFTVLNGAGDNTLSVTGGHLVAKNVFVKAGLGDGSITIANADVARHLDVKAGAGDVDVLIASSTVGGATRIDLGAGADSVTIDGVHLNGALAIQTGRGDDVVRLDSGGDPLGAPSVFDGRVIVRTGAGDDDIFLGTAGETGNSAVYGAAVILNGGLGDDLADVQDNGNTFAVTPTYIQLETIN